MLPVDSICKLVSLFSFVGVSPKLEWELGAGRTTRLGTPNPDGELDNYTATTEVMDHPKQGMLGKGWGQDMNQNLNKARGQI